MNPCKIKRITPWTRRILKNYDHHRFWGGWLCNYWNWNKTECFLVVSDVVQCSIHCVSLPSLVARNLRPKFVFIAVLFFNQDFSLEFMLFSFRFLSSNAHKSGASPQGSSSDERLGLLFPQLLPTWHRHDAFNLMSIFLQTLSDMSGCLSEVEAGRAAWGSGSCS